MLSYHFYPNETPDVFLVRAFKPFLEHHVWPVKGARAFFVRYDDEKGSHVRVRVRGEAEWEEALRPTMEGWFADRGMREEVSYTPEPERFGSEEALAWAEEHFHISTRVVLNRLAQPTYTYGDAMFDAVRMNVTAAHGAGLNRAETGTYFGRLCDSWLPFFFPAPDTVAPADFADAVKNDFQKTLQPQQEQLADTLYEVWRTLELKKIDTKQPDWVRWLRGNELIFAGLGSNLEKALPSLLHLNNNRLGLTNQDEVYINYLIANTLK